MYANNIEFNTNAKYHLQGDNNTSNHVGQAVISCR